MAILVHVALLQVWVGPYPLSTQWWADGFVLMPVVMAVAVTIAATDPGDRRASTWLVDREVPDTPSARRYVRGWLSSTRACRAIGFFGVGLLGTVAAWSVNTAGLPADSAVRDRLVDLTGGGWAAGIAGYAVGALVAEVLRRPPGRGEGRRADLRPRVPAAYMQPMARWGPALLGSVGLAVAASSAGVGRDLVAGPSAGELAVTSLATVAGTEVIRWVIVRHRQVAADPDSVALDDAARATTVHAVSGSAIGIVGSTLGNHLWNLSNDLGGPLRWLAMAASLVGLVSIGIWLGYGVGLAWVVRRGPRPTATPSGRHA